MDRGLGWNPELEAQHDTEMSTLFRPVCAVADSEIPDEIDYGDALPINDQFMFNTCCGNAVDCALQADHYVNTGKVVNLSARASYLFARLVDGTNNGPDAGASIQGGALGAKTYGCVKEEDFPYWDRDEPFNPQIPPWLFDKAQAGRVRAAAPIRGYDDWLRVTGTRQGMTIIGIWWTDALRAYRGKGPVINDRGSRIGGHALASFEYKLVNGEKFPIVRNSHSRQWGWNGRMWVAPDIFDRWLRTAPFGAMCVTGTPSFVKRTKPEMIQEAFS